MKDSELNTGFVNWVDRFRRFFDLVRFLWVGCLLLVTWPVLACVMVWVFLWQTIKLWLGMSGFCFFDKTHSSSQSFLCLVCDLICAFRERCLVFLFETRRVFRQLYQYSKLVWTQSDLGRADPDCATSFIEDFGDDFAMSATEKRLMDLYYIQHHVVHLSKLSAHKWTCQALVSLEAFLGCLANVVQVNWFGGYVIDDVCLAQCRRSVMVLYTLLPIGKPRLQCRSGSQEQLFLQAWMRLLFHDVRPLRQYTQCGKGALAQCSIALSHLKLTLSYLMRGESFVSDKIGNFRPIIQSLQEAFSSKLETLTDIDFFSAMLNDCQVDLCVKFPNLLELSSLKSLDLMSSLQDCHVSLRTRHQTLDQQLKLLRTMVDECNLCHC